jgi:hypothetical protein
MRQQQHCCGSSEPASAGVRTNVVDEAHVGDELGTCVRSVACRGRVSLHAYVFLLEWLLLFHMQHVCTEHHALLDDLVAADIAGHPFCPVCLALAQDNR